MQPTGLALYVRAIDRDRHGSPKQLAKKFADHGASWVAIAGPWHDDKGCRMINKPETVRRYADAFEEKGILPYVWGYPWQGSEDRFAAELHSCSGERKLVLLDPELGANPTRAKKGAGKTKANAHAAMLVSLMADHFPGGVCGVSTFGSGARMGWFPTRAFVHALATCFPSRSFIGGQTYTDDTRIDPSIADFCQVIEDVTYKHIVGLVPNFGTYSKVAIAGKKIKYRAKTQVEMDAHFLEFIDEAEPIDALIGWAENFMNPELWHSFARMADRMSRGATVLP